MSIAERFNRKDRTNAIIVGSGLATLPLVYGALKMAQTLPDSPTRFAVMLLVCVGASSLCSRAAMKLYRWHKAHRRQMERAPRLGE